MRRGSRRAPIQEEHRALAASLEAAAAHAAAAAKLRVDHAAEATEQEVKHMARADDEAEQERRCLRQESAALTKTFESPDIGRAQGRRRGHGPMPRRRPHAGRRGAPRDPRQPHLPREFFPIRTKVTQTKMIISY
jgi:hypothetical protein